MLWTDEHNSTQWILPLKIMINNNTSRIFPQNVACGSSKRGVLVCETITRSESASVHISAAGQFEGHRA